MELNNSDKKALQMLFIPFAAAIMLPLFRGAAALVAASFGLAMAPAIALVALAATITYYVMNMASLGLGYNSELTLTTYYAGHFYSFTFQMWQWSIIAILIAAGGAA